MGRFLRTARLRTEAAAVAGICELTLEHVFGLAVALAEGSELCLMHCVDCGAAVLVDKLGLMRRRCADCERHVHKETGTDQCGTVAD